VIIIITVTDFLIHRDHHHRHRSPIINTVTDSIAVAGNCS
jgi:hypothetical protein